MKETKPGYESQGEDFNAQEQLEDYELESSLEELKAKVGDPYETCEEGGYIGSSFLDEFRLAEQTILDIAPDQFKGKFISERDISRVSVNFVDRFFQKRVEDAGVEAIFSPEKHPQQSINALMDPRNRFLYNSEGEDVSLVEYLREYYEDSGVEGLEIGVDFIDSSEITEDSEYSYLLKRDGEKGKGIIQRLNEAEAQVPVLKLKNQNRTKQIPIVMTYYRRGSEKTTVGNYSCVKDESGLTRDEAIYVLTPQGMKGIQGHKEIVSYIGVLCHEVDHAVYEFLHLTESKKLGLKVEALRKERGRFVDRLDEAQNEEERNKLIEEMEALITEENQIKNSPEYYGDRIENHRGHILAEGLASTLAESFEEDQFKHIAQNYSSNPEDLERALSYNMLIERRSNFRNLNNSLYSVGIILAQGIRIKSLEHYGDLYQTELLGEVLTDQKLFNDSLAGVVSFHLESLKRLSEKKEVSLPNREQLQLQVRGALGEALGGRYPALILGDEIKEIEDKAQEKVSQITDEELESEFANFLKDNPQFSEFEVDPELTLREELAHYLYLDYSLNRSKEVLYGIIDRAIEKAQNES